MAGLTLRLVFVEYVALRTLDSLIFFLHTYTYVRSAIQHPPAADQIRSASFPPPHLVLASFDH